MAETCGAKTRSGEPCKRAPVPGKTRCKLHGGLSKGSPGHQNAKTHGIYSTHWTPEDHDRAAQAQTLLGSLDAEIELLRVRIARILGAEASGMFPDTDFHALLDRYVGRLGSLETQRKALTDNASTEQIITIRGGF